LTRYRRKMSEAPAAERNRLIKLLESANIKLSGVVSDIFGVSGSMLNALIEGEETPAEMAQHARGRMKRKRGELELALNGNFDEHHRFMLRLQSSGSRRRRSILNGWISGCARSWRPMPHWSSGCPRWW
jgi:hypothetical protein